MCLDPTRHIRENVEESKVGFLSCIMQADAVSKPARYTRCLFITFLPVPRHNMSSLDPPGHPATAAAVICKQTRKQIDGAYQHTPQYVACLPDLRKKHTVENHRIFLSFIVSRSGKASEPLKMAPTQRGSTPMYSKSALFAMRVAYLPWMSNMYAKSSEILFSMRPRTCLLYTSDAADE